MIVMMVVLVVVRGMLVMAVKGMDVLAKIAKGMLGTIAKRMVESVRGMDVLATTAKGMAEFVWTAVTQTTMIAKTSMTPPKKQDPTAHPRKDAESTDPTERSWGKQRSRSYASCLDSDTSDSSDQKATTTASSSDESPNSTDAPAVPWTRAPCWPAHACAAAPPSCWRWLGKCPVAAWRTESGMRNTKIA